MKKTLLDIIKEAQNVPQPLLNLNTVNKQSLPQITTGLQNLVKAQDQLKQQQQKMMQQQQVQQKAMMPTNVQQTGVMREVETMTTHNQDKSPMGMSDKNSPKDPMPIPMAGAQATQSQTVQETDTVRYETEDHIDELLYRNFGFTYFKDFSKPAEVIRKQDIQGSLFPEKPKPAVNVPMWKTMSDNEKEYAFSRNYKLKSVIALLDAGNNGTAFATLNRATQKINEQNFVGSKIFSIIAENENPRISKNDFINYLKTRKK